MRSSVLQAAPASFARALPYPPIGSLAEVGLGVNAHDAATASANIVRVTMEHRLQDFIGFSLVRINYLTSCRYGITENSGGIDRAGEG